MFPVTLGAQEYLTSQRLHQDYHANATERGEKPKYKKHEAFTRVIKSIPSYPILLEHKDIVVIEWKKLKSGKNDVLTPNVRCLLSPLFIQNGHRPLTLLNRTAQTELIHHLEDELNQELAYRHSKHGLDAPTAKQGLLRTMAADFEAKFQGKLAAHLNALNAKTNQGIPKLPTDTGSELVAGIVPNRIKQMYEVTLGDVVYREAKARAKTQHAQATHQVIQDVPLDMIRGFMLGMAIAATSEQHYDDLLEAAAGNQQLCLAYRWPEPAQLLEPRA
jgi:hypothetical protein